jgi:hypothetical protein
MVGRNDELTSGQDGGAGGVHALYDKMVEHHLVLGPLDDVLVHAGLRHQPATQSSINKVGVLHIFLPVFRVRDIWVRIRIRILGSVPLTNGSGSVPKSDF